MTGLHDMVRLLAGSSVEPVVLFYQDGAHAERFRSLGAEVRVLEDASSSSSRSPTAGLMDAAKPLKRVRGVKELNRLLRRDVRLAGRIRSHIRELEPDLVHHNDNPRGDRASILAAWMEGVPQICHVRFTDTLYAPVDRFVARTADRLIFMSKWIRDTVEAELGGVVDEGEVVYDPVDYDVFAPDSGSRESVVQELGLDPKAPLVVNVGRLVDWKGQDVFIRAASRVLEDRPESVFLLVGAGTDDGDTGYVGELRRLADRLGATEAVTFTGRRDDVPRLMAAADVVVHSATRPEPFGRVLVEALSCATPVVASDSGGPKEIVDHGVTGVLTPPGDPQAMAEGICRLLARTSESEAMGREGRRIVMDRFSAGSFVRGIESIYAGVLRRATTGQQPQSGSYHD